LTSNFPESIISLNTTKLPFSAARCRGVDPSIFLHLYQSVNLLAQILNATGDIVDAEAYKAQLALLPPGLHGSTPSDSMLTAECVEIEQLCHLDAKHVAEEIGKSFFKALLTDKKERDSVKENILKGSSLVSSTRGWSLIHTLAAYGRELAVQLLLEKGANLEAPSDHGTPLVVAALYGYEGTVKLLLEKGAQLEARNKYGGTPLSVATMNGYEGIVKLLIDRGANIEGKDKKGNTPLMCGARQNNWRIVEFLLWKGADVEARMHHQSSHLFLLIHLSLDSWNLLHLRHYTNATLRIRAVMINVKQNDRPGTVIWMIHLNKATVACP